MITFNCMKCNARLKVADDKQGKQVKCPQCITILTVPKKNIDDSSGVTKNSPTPDPYGVAEPKKACPFCGETILEVAKKCKHCGEHLVPIESTLPNKTIPNLQNMSKKEETVRHRTGLLSMSLNLKQGCVAVLGIVVISVLFAPVCATIDKDVRHAITKVIDTEVPSVSRESCTPVDLDQLYHDHLDNEVRTWASWKGKHVSITGVASVGGGADITLDIPTVGVNGAQVSCSLASSVESKIMSINNRDTITVYGEFWFHFGIVSDGTFMVHLEGCDFDIK